MLPQQSHIRLKFNIKKQFDLLCSSWLLRTALAAMLRGNMDEGWLTHFGLKCSSNTAVNAGTSSRSKCSSIGNLDYQSVRDSNCLGSRTFECIVDIHTCSIWIYIYDNVESKYHSCTYIPSNIPTISIHIPGRFFWWWWQFASMPA